MLIPRGIKNSCNYPNLGDSLKWCQLCPFILKDEEEGLLSVKGIRLALS